MIEKTASISPALATIAILGQAPSAEKIEAQKMIYFESNPTDTCCIKQTLKIDHTERDDESPRLQSTQFK